MEALRMATEIRIPKIGMSATEMTLSEWMFGDGEEVAQGDVIYTIETDKTTTEIEAPSGGTLRIMGVEGETYPIGTLVGTIE
jgi:pyruvate/2-oxoglutarate dehydrogenase complex dihydrolipoamide acyltransferase (E2) component